MMSISSLERLILLTGAVSDTLSSHIGERARSGLFEEVAGAAATGALGASTCLGLSGSFTPLDLSSIYNKLTRNFLQGCLLPMNLIEG